MSRITAINREQGDRPPVIDGSKLKKKKKCRHFFEKGEICYPVLDNEMLWPQISIFYYSNCIDCNCCYAILKNPAIGQNSK